MGKPVFLELKVFRLAERLADALYTVVGDWEQYPRTTVGDPLVKAVDSVGALIASGHARGMTRPDRRAVRAAFNEALYWLRRANRRELFTEEQVAQIKPLFDDLGQRVGAYLRRMAQRGGGSDSQG